MNPHIKSFLFQIKHFLSEAKKYLKQGLQGFFDFNQRSFIKTSFFLVLIFFSLASFVIVFFPSMREPLRATYLKKKPYRKILSSLSSRLFPDRRYFRIIKIKTHEGLFIEIYKSNMSSKPPLLFDRIRLPHSYNGYFHVRKQAVDLTVYDVDKDRNMEILAPSFNEYFSAHLNVYTYDFKKNRFVEFSPPLLDSLSQRN